MGLTLEQVVPWGRSLAEYVQMFDLTTDDLQRSIVDCGGGPASFNAEMTRQEHSVISCDPLYQFDRDAIAQRIRDTYTLIMEGVEANHENYIWKEISSPAALGIVRMTAMQKFLEDFPVGLQQGRYQSAALPILPFLPRHFDLALCSHLLFTYSDQLSLEFHLSAIAEMCRVATEVRIFPLLKVSGEPSPWLAPVRTRLAVWGYRSQIRQVSYEFQHGGNQLLQICRLNLTGS